jgi:hypothetical protein
VEDRASRFGGQGEKKYRSQDRGGRFGGAKSSSRDERSRDVPPAARPTSPARGQQPRVERADEGTTRRFEPSRRFSDKGGAKFGKASRREAPPPQPWERKPEAEETEEQPKPKGGFDARATLDRLWKERGGGGGRKR